MSVLIAICDKNMALLAADSRETLNQDEEGNDCFNDDCHKIFRFNDRLIFGAAGGYKRHEDLCEAFKDHDLSVLTLDQADKLIQKYMQKVLQWKTDLRERCYILCGQNADNEICIYTYEYNVLLREEKIHHWNMAHEDVCKFHVGLSPILSKQADKYADKLRAIYNNVNTIQELKNGVSELIREIAKADWTVGGEPEIITI